MEKLTPEKAKEILAKKGMSVSIEEAAGILELLRKLAKLIVLNYLDGK